MAPCPLRWFDWLALIGTIVTVVSAVLGFVVAGAYRAAGLIGLLVGVLLLTGFFIVRRNRDDLPPWRVADLKESAEMKAQRGKPRDQPRQPMDTKELINESRVLPPQGRWDLRC